jgi:SAM-dependent methyltransferase
VDGHTDLDFQEKALSREVERFLKDDAFCGATQRPAARYWDRMAWRKTFAHPLRQDWLAAHLRPNARVLDYGCGYGRILNRLAQAGYRRPFGLDVSFEMLARARGQGPAAPLVQSDGRVVPFADSVFDAVLLFAVLTCVVEDADQRALLSEIERVLKPAGLLYISDYLLSDEARNVDRYRRHAPQYGTYGVFETSDGGLFRHHRPERIAQLTSAFSPLAFEPFVATTMNGHRTRAFQYLGRRGEGA